MFKRKDVCEDCLHNDTPLYNFGVGWISGATAPTFAFIGIMLKLPINVIGMLILCGSVVLWYDSWVERATWHWYAGCVFVWALFALLLWRG